MRGQIKLKNKLIIIGTLILIFLSFSFLIFKMWVRNNVSNPQIAVLMYHQVIEDDLYNGQADRIKLSTFEKHLNYFKEHNYKTLTLDEFYCWKKGKCEIPTKSVLLTFDDGFYSFHYLVEPLLKKYNFHAINFVIGNTLPEITKEYKMMEYGTIGIDLIENHSEYVDYQSHSYGMHTLVDGKQRIYSMTNEEIQSDLDKMAEISNFEYISYPYNTEVDEFIALLKANKYKLGFRGENEKASRNCNDYQVPRIGIREDFSHFKTIFESTKYNNRYGCGLLRKIFVTIERKLNIKLG